MKQDGETTLTTVKKFLKNSGRHLNNGGLLSKLQKAKDDGSGFNTIRALASQFDLMSSCFKNNILFINNF